MTHQGRLQHVDLGAGAYVLVLADHRRYLLEGPVPEHLVGQQVKVEGTLVELSGFAMTGDPVLRVERISPA